MSYTALSPLFVKVWRMYTLVTASRGFVRVNVTHFQAFLYSLPICIVEFVILTIFSFVDPPRVAEVLGVGGGFGMQRITCEQVRTYILATASAELINAESTPRKEMILYTNVHIY
jgi:hypothetical protein